MSKKNRKLKVVRTEDLTGWFDSTQRPAKPGVYEVKSPDGTHGKFYSYWNGEAWCHICSADSVIHYMGENFIADSNQTRTWRGIQGD